MSISYLKNETELRLNDPYRSLAIKCILMLCCLRDTYTSPFITFLLLKQYMRKYQ